MEEDELPDNFDQAYNWFSQQYSVQKAQEQQIADPLLNDTEQSAFSSFLDNVLADPNHASEPFESRWSEKDFYKGFKEVTEQPIYDVQYRPYMAQQPFVPQASFVQQKPFKMHTMALPADHGSFRGGTHAHQSVGYAGHPLGGVPVVPAVGQAVGQAAHQAAPTGQASVTARAAPGASGYPLALVPRSGTPTTPHVHTAPQTRAHTPGAPGREQASSASLPSRTATNAPASAPGHTGHPSHTPGHPTEQLASLAALPPAQRFQKDFKVKKREFLSESQVRQNHVSSEKRRRDLISQHFKALCAMVPAITNASPNLPKSTVLQHAYDYILQVAEENKALRKALAKAGVDTLQIEAHKPHPPLVEE